MYTLPLLITLSATFSTITARPAPPQTKGLGVLNPQVPAFVPNADADDQSQPYFDEGWDTDEEDALYKQKYLHQRPPPSPSVYSQDSERDTLETSKTSGGNTNSLENSMLEQPSANTSPREIIVGPAPRPRVTDLASLYRSCLPNSPQSDKSIRGDDERLNSSFQRLNAGTSGRKLIDIGFTHSPTTWSWAVMSRRPIFVDKSGSMRPDHFHNDFYNVDNDQVAAKCCDNPKCRYGKLYGNSAADIRL